METSIFRQAEKAGLRVDIGDTSKGITLFGVFDGDSQLMEGTAREIGFFIRGYLARDSARQLSLPR